MKLSKEQINLIGKALMRYRWEVEQQSGTSHPDFQAAASLADLLEVNHNGGTLEFNISEKQSGEYSHNFNSELVDVSFHDIIKLSETPIINLRPLRGIPNYSHLIKRILTPFFDLAPEHQSKVVFIGERRDVELLLISIPQKKEEILANPSIQKLLK